MRRTTAWATCVLGLALGACGDDSAEQTPEMCTLGTSEGCEGGFVCESVNGEGEPACFAPVVIRGRVFDTADDSGIGGASIVALDVNGSARSSVAFSEDDGSYELLLPVTRDADGDPIGDSVQLRVAAAGYQAFPLPPREALPIDLDARVDTGGDGGVEEHVIMNAATDVGLVALPNASGDDATIEGSIDHELGAGALFLAVQGGEAVSTAIADADGEFVLFNVPPGDTTIEAYRQGVAVEPAMVTPDTAEHVEDVVLSAGVDGLTTVSGKVEIVNAPGASMTTVILVPRSTFVENVARGIAPAGLRADDVTSDFSIEGVAPGEWTVLAAFENDLLVRDPDQSIAGTDIVHITVAGEGTYELMDSFKVTEALAVRSPGRDGLEVVGTGDPTFTWADDSSEDGYELRVYDAFGNLVHEALDIARVNGGTDVSYTWSGATLERGGIYQFRVVSWSTSGNSSTRSYLSATEDLRGVFQVGTPDQGSGT
jgi:hypothetical protein